MANSFSEITTAELWAESRLITIQLSRPSPTSVELSWTIPSSVKALAGYVILLSEKKISSVNYPIDSQRYIPSLDLANPESEIEDAQIVGVAYAAFGDTVVSGSLTVINVDPNKLYYASIHGCSNILQYYPYGIQSYPLDSARIEKAPTVFGGNIDQNVGPPLNPTLGQVYYDPTTNKVQMWSGMAWVPAGTGSVKTGSDADRPTGDAATTGTFFYNKDNRELQIFNGTSWTKANNDQEGVPMVDKTSVGTTGSYQERLRLAGVLKRQLGYPAVCNELNEEHFNIAIDNAIETFRSRADNAYQNQFIVMPLQLDQSLYYLNDPTIGTDKVVSVNKIHRISTIGFNAYGGDAAVYSQIFFQQFLYGASIDILSVHLTHQLAEEYERVFAGNFQFTWNEAKRELLILRKIFREERIVLDCVMERTEQELLSDRYAKQWLQAWAESELMMTLGHIRSKYGNLPGPNGGITLNGAELISQATEMQVELQRQLNDYEVGNGGVEFVNTGILIG